MGGRKRHLGSFICWTMINGLAFSWSVLPLRSLWASPDKRVFERERTPQILLFVPDSIQPTPQCPVFNQRKPAKQGSAFMCESQSLILCLRMRTHVHVCLFVGVCVREKWRQWGDRRGRSLERLKKSQYTTLHWHVSPLLLLRHSELCLRGTWVDLGEG